VLDDMNSFENLYYGQNSYDIFHESSVVTWPCKCPLRSDKHNAPSSLDDLSSQVYTPDFLQPFAPTKNGILVASPIFLVSHSMYVFSLFMGGSHEYQKYCVLFIMINKRAIKTLLIRLQWNLTWITL
jgi:hypothetical protein